MKKSSPRLPKSPIKPYAKSHTNPHAKANPNGKESAREERVEQARQLYLMGLTYREIAARIGLAETGYVTVSRWVNQYGWKAEREEQRQDEKKSKKETYLRRVATVQDAHLRLAEKIRIAAEFALDGYLITDEHHNILGVKTHPKTGLPAIGPYAIQQLIGMAADLERKALGVELLPTEDMAQISAPTIDATPIDESQQELLKRMGDYLAHSTLISDAVTDATESNLPLPSLPSVSTEDTPEERVVPDTAQML